MFLGFYRLVRLSVSAVRAAALMLAMALPASAQTPGADAKMIAAQQAFEALPEPLRKAIQFDLTFVGGFTGGASGGFGPLTYLAIQNFKRAARLEGDAVLSVAERQLLALEAGKARQALKYSVLSDARSGARIGVPQALLSRTEPNSFGGSRWQSKDGRVTLDTRVGAPGEVLAALFEKATAPSTSGRKITYKLLRPEFYVISGETQAGKFYSRMAQGPDGTLRGFSIGYDKALGGQMDRLVIAIANGFEAFPAATPVAVASAPSAAPSAARPLAGTSVGPSGVALPSTQPAAQKGRVGTGLQLDATHVVAASAITNGCTSLAAGTRRIAAKLVTTDATLGLALLRTESPIGGASARVAREVASGPLVAWGYATNSGAPTLIYAEASGDLGARKIAAPLQHGGAGAALINRDGAVAGMVSGDPSARKTVAGIVPMAVYAAVTAGDILAMAGRNGVVVPALGVETARNLSPDGVISVFCNL